ncbi:sporulation membrane protein YtaF [Peribacillus sp. SCS-155]|uniref:sporulation membrane protein YtaF n=1 Tax=Peribacillus sedimenti TaxID=3115297 RepID=UPI0039067377
MWLQLLFLAFAVSIDSFGVGLTYGLKKMKISVASIAVIACCSAISLGVSMTIGEMISRFFSAVTAEKIGGSILIFIGCWVVYQYFRPEKQMEEKHEKTLINLEIKSLGLVINILRKPLTADFDKSGAINGIEAFMLGLALSLDAFGAGIAAAMIGISPIILSIISASMSGLFIWGGVQSGKLLAENHLIRKITFLPGVLLIIIGVIKF